MLPILIIIVNNIITLEAVLMKIKYSICKYKLKHWHAESETAPPNLDSRVTLTWRQNINTNNRQDLIEPNKLDKDVHAKCVRSSLG